MTTPESPTVRKRSRRRRDSDDASPEEIAAKALANPGGEVDGRLQGLPCLVCGEFPGSCTAEPMHSYTAPEGMLRFDAADPIFVHGPDLPDPDDQVHVNRHIEVAATMMGGFQTRIIAYVPGDIISRQEAYRVGYLVDLRKDPSEPPPPPPPASPLGEGYELDVSGSLSYMPPRGEWTL